MKVSNLRYLRRRLGLERPRKHVRRAPVAGAPKGCDCESCSV